MLRAPPTRLAAYDGAEVRMRTRTKTALGSFLATFGALGVVLSAVLGWAAQRPWSFVFGFAAGLSAGLGTALALAGLVERKRSKAET
jgi:FtsH-binding integral membrane protein